MRIPSFTQVKWTGDPRKLLTASNVGLDSMVTEAINRCVELNIQPYDKDMNPQFMIDVVTSGGGLHYYTEDVKMRKIPVRTIGYKALGQEFDDNKPFWNGAYEMVSMNQPGIGKGKILHTCQNKDTYWPDLFKDCKGINEFNKRHDKKLKELVKENGIDIKTYDVPHRVGDGGELFTICMYKLNETNKRFGVQEYKQTISDNGLDGEGFKE